MDNPYSAPRESSAAPPPPITQLPDELRPRGMVGHVRVLGILMIVQGAFILLMAALAGLYAVLLPVMLSLAEEGQGDQPPKEVLWIFGGVLGSICIVLLVVAVLHCYSGYRTFLFRSRTLAIGTLISGMLAALTCYCAPTGIGLLIYGLIVMMDNSVREAFELAEQGYKPDEIDMLFNPFALEYLRAQQPPPPSGA